MHISPFADRARSLRDESVGCDDRGVTLMGPEALSEGASTQAGRGGSSRRSPRPPGLHPSEGDAVVTGLPARLEGVIGQRHGDDRIGRMPAPEQIVFPAVQVLGIERVDPRTDDLVPFDGPNVVPEEVGPDTPDQRDALELVVGGEVLTPLYVKTLLQAAWMIS